MRRASGHRTGWVPGRAVVLGTAIDAASPALFNIERLTAESRRAVAARSSEQALQKFEQALTQIRGSVSGGRE